MSFFRKIASIIDKIYNTLLLYHHKIKHGNNLDIRGKIFITNNVELGNNVKINSGKNKNVIGGQTKTHLVSMCNGSIKIGNNVRISNSTLVSRESIIVEDNVMIGGSCKIYDTDFHSINYESRIKIPDVNIKSKRVIIKEGAFIGAHSIILKGVTIGKHSVIGAGSVVTRDVPDNEVWAGNPAKFIKKI